MILPLKQSAALIYWLAMGMLFQYEQPTMPIIYAFTGAIGVGLLVTLIWIVSPLISARMYRERIAELERRLKNMEERLDVTNFQNAQLVEKTRRYDAEMEMALKTIATMSVQINELRRANGEITDR